MKLLKGKKEKVARTNIEKWINEFIFDRSITYANTHKTIAGVENIKRDMQDNLQKYNEEMQSEVLYGKPSTKKIIFTYISRNSTNVRVVKKLFS